MSSNQQFKEDLIVLEINEEQTLTKKYVTSKYKKLAKTRHPDKEGGTKSAFQTLLNAYRRIIDYLDGKIVKEAFEEEEKDFETEFFMKHNFMKECTSSFVVYIQDWLVDRWKRVLERHMKIHKSDKFKIIFKTGEITLTLYDKPKKDPRSKLHIQGGDQNKNLDFILEKLSKFYREVCFLQETTSKALELRDLHRSLCIICGKHFTNKRGLKQHIIRIHDNKTKKIVVNKKDMEISVTLDEIVNVSKSSGSDVVPVALATLSQPMSDITRSPVPKKQKMEENKSCEEDESEFIRDLVKEVIEQSSAQIDTNYQCGECSKTFESMNESVVHIQNDHREVRAPGQGSNKQLTGLSKCDICGFVSMNADEFGAHMKDSHNNQPGKERDQEQILVNDARTEEEHNNCEKCNEEKQLLKKQMTDLQMLLEVSTETFNEQYEAKKKELEKIKKERLKSDKENEVVIRELKEQLSRSFAEVKKVTEAITKVEEEKKTLLGIHKVNIDLQKEVERRKYSSSEHEHEEVTISDCEDDTDDEESVAFNMVQRKNKFTRTSPMTEAVYSKQTKQDSIANKDGLNHLKCKECSYQAKNETNLRGHMSGHNISCEKCKSVLKTVELLRQHMRSVHGSSQSQDQTDPNQRTPQSVDFPCKMCDFKAKTTLQLEKHVQVRHSEMQTNIPCSFWMRGICRFGQMCKFSHKNNKLCKFQNECYAWPNCKFEHREVIKPCYYQENCLNINCKFEHFFQENFEGTMQNNFLGVNSLTEFPPLTPVWMPW